MTEPTTLNETRPRIRVAVHLWGSTDRNAQDAAANMHHHPDYWRWQVATTEQHTSPVTTIQPNDRKAEAQRAGYGWAWAVYRLTPRDE